MIAFQDPLGQLPVQASLRNAVSVRKGASALERRAESRWYQAQTADFQSQPQMAGSPGCVDLTDVEPTVSLASLQS